MIHSSPFPLALVAGSHWCLPSKMPSVQVKCFKCFFGRLWRGLWWGELWGCGCWCWPGIPERVCWLQKMVGWQNSWWFWGCPTQVDWETQSLFEVWCYFLWLHLNVHYVFYFFVIYHHLYQELTNSNVQYVNICYISCGLMGPACPVPVLSCQCQGTQVASKLKAAREQIAQRLAELRKKSKEKLSLVSWDHFWWVVGTG